MHYYNPENREPQIWGAIAVVIYLIITAVLMFTLSFYIESTDPAAEGILVEFGESDLGEGVQELAATDVASPTPPPQEEQPHEPLEVDQREEIELEQQEIESKKSSETTQAEQPQLRDTVVPEPRVVNQNALFPGRSEQSTESSQGNAGGNGNQGSESGANEGAPVGGGEGNEAVAVLKDRSVVGQLPKPDYNEDVAGKVIIDITVDDAGVVKSATYRAQGSTTNNSQLVSAAQAAALKARFTPSDNFIQGGTITYIFKMN